MGTEFLRDDRFQKLTGVRVHQSEHIKHCKAVWFKWVILQHVVSQQSLQKKLWLNLKAQELEWQKV